MPADLEAVARYVRWEYGPHTRVEYLLSEIVNGAPAPRSRGMEGLREAIHALARAVKSLVGGNGRRASAAEAPELVR